MLDHLENTREHSIILVEPIITTSTHARTRTHAQNKQASSRRPHLQEEYAVCLKEVEHDSMFFEVKVNPVGWRCVRVDALVRKMAEAAGFTERPRFLPDPPLKSSSLMKELYPQSWLIRWYPSCSVATGQVSH